MQKDEPMIYLDRNDPALAIVAGGVQQANEAAINAAIAAYDYNNPTQGVTNFQPPSTVYAGGVTESSAWIPSTDLYVFEDYDASNGQPLDVVFDYNGNGYNASEMGGSFVDEEYTPYGLSLMDQAEQENGGAVDVVEDPGEWLEAYAEAGGEIDDNS